MVTKLKPLFEYSLDVFSQNGEDGIIKFIFNELKIDHGFLLEVGAHNGIWCSNTRNLYKNNQNFKSVLIEGEDNLFEELRKNCSNHENTYLIKRFIDFDTNSSNSIDNILKEINLQNEKFVLISIDIDGTDYDVWKSLKIEPTLLIIEVPIFLENVEGKQNIQDHIKLGIEKNYTFLGMSGYLNRQAGNLLFLHNDYIEHFELPELHERILLHGGQRCQTINL